MSIPGFLRELRRRKVTRVADRHEVYSGWIASDREIVDAFRDDPRFRALVQRVGIPDP